jgi:hypothetical protein
VEDPRSKPIPIYTTPGDWSAIMLYPYLYNTMGEWIGFVTREQHVYDVDGIYVGWITDEPRILPRTTPPEHPDRIRLPATVPLPPMMAEIPFEIVDVLFEEPERLHTTDTGEFKEDMD